MSAEGPRDMHRKCSDYFREDPGYVCSGDCPGRLFDVEGVDHEDACDDCDEDECECGCDWCYERAEARSEADRADRATRRAESGFGA